MSHVTGVYWEARIASPERTAYGNTKEQAIANLGPVGDQAVYCWRRVGELAREDERAATTG